MSSTERAAPVVDLPIKEALQELTGFEVIGIQKHYGTLLEKLGGACTLMGAVWAYENRREKTSWVAVESRSMHALEHYFADNDPDPDSDQGKALSG